MQECPLCQVEIHSRPDYKPVTSAFDRHKSRIVIDRIVDVRVVEIGIIEFGCEHLFIRITCLQDPGRLLARMLEQRIQVVIFRIGITSVSRDIDIWIKECGPGRRGARDARTSIENPTLDFTLLTGIFVVFFVQPDTVVVVRKYSQRGLNLPVLCKRRCRHSRKEQRRDHAGTCSARCMFQSVCPSVQHVHFANFLQ